MERPAWKNRNATNVLDLAYRSARGASASALNFSKERDNMNAKKNALIAAAAAGILGGLAVGCGGDKPAASPDGTSATTTPSSVTAPAAPGAKHACKGQNDCKGQGGCKSDKNACKGQNTCKGQGGCKTA